MTRDFVHFPVGLEGPAVLTLLLQYGTIDNGTPVLRYTSHIEGSCCMLCVHRSRRRRRRRRAPVVAEGAAKRQIKV